MKKVIKFAFGVLSTAFAVAAFAIIAYWCGWALFTESLGVFALVFLASIPVGMVVYIVLNAGLAIIESSTSRQNKSLCKLS